MLLESVLCLPWLFIDVFHVNSNLHRQRCNCQDYGGVKRIQKLNFRGMLPGLVSVHRLLRCVLSCGLQQCDDSRRGRFCPVHCNDWFIMLRNAHYYDLLAWKGTPTHSLSSLCICFGIFFGQLLAICIIQ